jgi:hypothetical protein
MEEIDKLEVSGCGIRLGKRLHLVRRVADRRGTADVLPVMRQATFRALYGARDSGGAPWALPGVSTRQPIPQARPVGSQPYPPGKVRRVLIRKTRVRGLAADWST